MRAKNINLGSSRWASNNELITGEDLEKVKELDSYYSPIDLPTQTLGVLDGGIRSRLEFKTESYSRRNF